MPDPASFHPLTAPPARRWSADPSAEAQLDSHPCAMLTSPKQNTQTLAGLSLIPNKKGVHRANTATMTEGAGRRRGDSAEISSYLAGSVLELDFFGWRCEGGRVGGAGSARSPEHMKHYIDVLYFHIFIESAALIE